MQFWAQQRYAIIVTHLLGTWFRGCVYPCKCVHEVEPCPQILSDSNLITAAYVDAAFCIFFLISFILLQSRSILYKFRLVWKGLPGLQIAGPG